MRNLVALAAALLLAGSVYANPVSPHNSNRPQTITGSGVQDGLDDIFGEDVVDDVDDQQTAGYFKVANPGSNVISPQFKIKNQSDLSIGIFSLPGLDDNNTITAYEFFESDADEDWYANISWDAGEQFKGKINIFDDTNSFVKSIDFDDINRNGFGFYAEDDNDHRYYSLDDLNDGAAEVLSYSDGNTNWAFFFETDASSTQTTAPSKDFDEAAFYVESVTP